MTMSVTFSIGLEPNRRPAEADLGGICFSVPPVPIGAKLLQGLTITMIQEALETPALQSNF